LSLRVLLVAVALLATGVVMRQARAEAWRLPAHRIGAATARFLDLPDWVDEPLRRALHDPAHLRFSASVFDPDAEAAVRDTLSRHPNVREVRRVVVEFPNRVGIEVRVRTPVAWVRIEGTGDFLLSDDRHLLDPRPYAGYLRRLRIPLALVTGIRARPPRSGHPWEDRDEQVQEAVEAARVAARIFRDLRGRVVVKRIDLSRFPAEPEARADGELRFVLGDHDRTQVEWGRTERDLDDGSEYGYAAKVRRLETWLDDPRVSRRGFLDVRYRTPPERP
jgi:hypothetical protein